MTVDVRAILAATVAAERLRVVAGLIRRSGDWELAEDAFQDAAARALATWPTRGIPDNPAAWLTTAARNALVDALRRSTSERTALARVKVEAIVDLEERRSSDSGAMEESAMDSRLDDDRLRLIFSCCHPALPLDARVALTLRTVVGLDVADIARAFLVTEAAMQKRLVRARAQIRREAIPYRVPSTQELPERTDAVLAVLYVLFTEGYAGGSELVSERLAGEAIRLARLLSELLSTTREAPEILGLLALMLFQHSRTPARLDEAGEIVLLEDQRRDAWDASMIQDALTQLDAADTARGVWDAGWGPYRVQAEIARQHAVAPDYARTDFARIAQLYGHLARMTPSPVIDVQRAIAVALAEGPEAGLELLDRVDESRLPSYHLLPATRADLLRRAGRGEEALPHYERAAALSTTEQERRLFARRIDQIRSAL